MAGVESVLFPRQCVRAARGGFGGSGVRTDFPSFTLVTDDDLGILKCEASRWRRSERRVRSLSLARTGSHAVRCGTEQGDRFHSSFAASGLSLNHTQCFLSDTCPELRGALASRGSGTAQLTQAPAEGPGEWAGHWAWRVPTACVPHRCS